VRRLLGTGADITLKDKDVHTAIYFTLERGGTEMNVRLLLHHGADPKAEISNHDIVITGTLLSWAMNQGQEVAMNLLELERECFDI
jgi:ankyrin repeat protein